VGKESELNHAMRLSMALSRLRVEPWPFQGRIGLREVHRASGLTEIHLLDRWCYLGTVRDPSALHDALETRHDLIFDLDTYQILTRFFKRHPDHLDIIPMSDSR
jgi:DNA polymerase-3 subunit epsilon